jgi:nucleotide-binding universal stress UspA family protein
MSETTQLLVPLDGSGLALNAIPYAQALVGDAGSIVLLQVVSPAKPVRSGLGTPVVSEEFTGAWGLETAHKGLDDTAESLRRHLPSSVSIRSIVSSGDPATEVLNAIGREKITTVVMTSHARGALGRAAFGSVADRVAHNADVPVVIIRPTDETGVIGRPAFFRRIVLPLDGSNLAAEAVPFAQNVATRLNLPISLVNVLDTVSTYAAAGALPLPQSALDEWWNEARDMLTPTATALEAAGITTKIEILQGAAFAAIANYAKPGDMIVMTTHGRTGFVRWLLGSVAEKLVRSAPVPVCVVPARKKGGAPAA